MYEHEKILHSIFTVFYFYGDDSYLILAINLIQHSINANFYSSFLLFIKRKSIDHIITYLYHPLTILILIVDNDRCSSGSFMRHQQLFYSSQSQGIFALLLFIFTAK